MHRNNFDALRVMAALMVIHGHGWTLTGGPGSGLWGVPFARVGLDVFFSISGYLVTASWERTPRLAAFGAKRALRIVPGLIACVVLTAFALGPAATRLGLADYLSRAETWRYLGNIALRNELGLPGVFDGLREDGAVNGSLWSLLPEVACYVTVPLLAPFGRARLWILPLLAFGLGGWGLVLFYGGVEHLPSVYHLDLRYGLVEVPFFLVGAWLRLAEARWAEGRCKVAVFREDACLLFFVANYLVSSWFDWWNLPVEWVTLPYMVLSFGRLSLPVLCRAARFGDLSFGLYLYAFPVQQAVLLWWPSAPLPILTCVGITAVLAFLSWHLVEAPALALGARLRASLDQVESPYRAKMLAKTKR